MESPNLRKLSTGWKVKVMTDKVYYKIQYPLKKAVETLNRVFLDEEKYEEEINKLNERDREKLKQFIEEWENGNRERLSNLVADLKEKMNQ